ncbi:MAG: adenosylcobalamin-dependent ribonucleoside-diphosphate reductase [Firmicutes bacterium]|nr:adenosylcobalamin-dependent ribonucleoside-diphosphate reductase [Bacillota bacterium]
MRLSEAGEVVFRERYARRDQQGAVIETPTEAVERLARTAAMAEKDGDRERWAEEFASVIDARFFIPSTPIWANLGKDDRPWQPAACFVLAVEDSLESMYQTLKETALICKSGGGVGYNFSSIRPRGDLVHTTKGQASGVTELIRLYNASAGMIKQGGVRRGAFMGILNCDHPEIIEFIRAKLDGGFENFNLSVGVTDRFMDAVVNDLPWELTFGGEIRNTLPAREVWRELAEAAWACGDPGVVFLDRLKESNPVPSNPIEATNPCGEQPLSAGESCLLGSINLAEIVREQGEEAEVDWERLTRTTRTAVRFLDNLIELAQYPLPLIDQRTRATRKVGLGVLGLHDLLIRCRRAYDSEEGRDLARQVMIRIRQEAHQTSRELGEEKGCFPDWERSVYSQGGEPRRNASCITIAPTGSITLLAGAEGYGIEPIFAIAYRKITQAGTLNNFSPLFQEACRRVGVEDRVMEEVARRGSAQGVDGVPPFLQRVFRGAREIAPADHLAMQIALQAEVDNAISKTINLPSATTMETIEEIYLQAYLGRLKGITIFREESRPGVIEMGRDPAGDKAPGREASSGSGSASRSYQRGEIRPRPKQTVGITQRLDTGCGKLYLTVNYDPVSGEAIETFVTTGSDGGCRAFTESTSRLVSMAIRAGVAIPEIVEQLISTRSCPSWQLSRGRGKRLSQGNCCPSAIGHALGEIVERNSIRLGESALENHVPDHPVGREAGRTPQYQPCPECGQDMAPAEGCHNCLHCGYSKC